MSSTALLALVVVLLVGLPVMILGAILFAYEGEESRSRRFFDTLLFTPFALFAFIIFIVMIGAIIFDGDWGLGVDLPFGSDLLAQGLEWLLCLSVVGSSVYLLVVRPGDLKAQFPRYRRVIDLLIVCVGYVRETRRVSTEERETARSPRDSTDDLAE